TAIDLLSAMDICKVSTNGSWGIVGTPTLTRASGSGAVDNRQIAVMTQFGTHDSNVAIANDTMATLSSGRARDGNDPDATTALTYSYVTGTPPADFLSAHGGALPTTKDGCPSGSGANDSVMLTVKLKVPTNALSLSFNFRFFSQEYWEYTCSEYNDFFIALLDTGAEGIPADKNISFDSNDGYISVNTDQFFTVCEVKEGYTCPDGTDPLAGTGYDQQEEDTGGCTPGYHYVAGATQWLTTSAPVIPGETITLRFVIWDTSDQALDSLVLIDNFKWSAEGTSGPVTFACWDTNKNGVCDVGTEDLSGDEKCSEFDCL
ncbi:MAG TPA: choice-of-anchor L domain-containing protein, partial [bacterium]|nr:choice-of-anchor L domain-containing protein [bacterium]